MMYERYRIESKFAPHIHPIPNRFEVSARKLRLAAMLVNEAIEYRFKRDVVLSRPCIYGVFSGRLGGFKPIKEKCVGCMRCVQEYPHIMTVRPSDAYKRLGDSYWTPDAVFNILYESSTGKIPVKGMGYKGSFGGDGFDGIWTDMSEIVRPTRDGVYGREYISTIVDVGRKPLSLDFSRPEALDHVRALEVPIPIIFDEIPQTTKEVSEAVAAAASKLDTFHVSRQTREAEQTPNWIPLVNQEYLATRSTALRSARIIEFDLDREDVYGNLRQVTPSALVSARMRLRQGCEYEAARLVREGIDILHVYADLHGMDYSPEPRHISDALKALHGHLVEEGVRDHVTIIAGGGITLAEHVPKAIICGADLVSIDSTLLVALQGEFRGQAKDRQACQLTPRMIDPAWGAQRIVNLMASWHDQLIEILSAMGMRDVRRLRGDVGRSMTDSDLREQAFEGISWAT